MAIRSVLRDRFFEGLILDYVHGKFAAKRLDTDQSAFQAIWDLFWPGIAKYG